MSNKIFNDGYLKTAFKIIESQIFSRIVGLLISPAAALDLAFHLIALPFSLIYAIGQSIYFRECDFTLPWQHLQRVRDSIFPLLFGTFANFIHPYLGVYAAEPAKKHIATGILLSGTEKDKFDSVCSPLTSISEIQTLLSKVEHDEKLARHERQCLNDIYFWEGEFEAIQSIDFFSLNLTYKIPELIARKLNASQLPRVVKEIAQRVSLLIYPILVVADLTILLAATLISLAMIPIRFMGGQSPAYLEKTLDPELHLYNLIKLPLFLICATVGFVVSLVNPKAGRKCVRYPMEWMAWIPFKLKILSIHHRIGKLNPGEFIVLPAVETFPMEEREVLPLLPTYGHHMRYLLIEKQQDGQYQTEMIERGDLHRKTDRLSLQETKEIVEKTLSLRFDFGIRQRKVLDEFQNPGDIDLGVQKGINNCIITNLFAALQVVRHKDGRNNFDALCLRLKRQAVFRYFMYARDYFPFGKTEEVIEEIETLASQLI